MPTQLHFATCCHFEVCFGADSTSSTGAPGRKGSPWHHPFPELPSELRHRCSGQQLSQLLMRLVAFLFVAGLGQGGSLAKGQCKNRSVCESLIFDFRFKRHTKHYKALLANSVAVDCNCM